MLFEFPGELTESCGVYGQNGVLKSPRPEKASVRRWPALVNYVVSGNDSTHREETSVMPTREPALVNYVVSGNDSTHRKKKASCQRGSPRSLTPSGRVLELRSRKNKSPGRESPDCMPERAPFQSRAGLTANGIWRSHSRGTCGIGDGPNTSECDEGKSSRCTLRRSGY